MDDIPAAPISAVPMREDAGPQADMVHSEAGPSNSVVNEGEVPSANAPAVAAQTGKKRQTETPNVPLQPLSETMLRRVTTIKEGDNVLLRLPSDSVKAVVASKEG